MMNANFSCGERIRQLRNERGLSQEQVALTADITPAYLGLVERGKRNATVAIVERICMAMNLSLAEFFSEATYSREVEDDVGRQILHWIAPLSEEEKRLCLQLIRTALQLKPHDATKKATDQET